MLAPPRNDGLCHSLFVIPYTHVVILSIAKNLVIGVIVSLLSSDPSTPLRFAQDDKGNEFSGRVQRVSGRIQRGFREDSGRIQRVSESFREYSGRAECVRHVVTNCSLISPCTLSAFSLTSLFSPCSSLSSLCFLPYAGRFLPTRITVERGGWVWGAVDGRGYYF